MSLYFQGYYIKYISISKTNPNIIDLRLGGVRGVSKTLEWKNSIHTKLNLNVSQPLPAVQEQSQEHHQLPTGGEENPGPDPRG